MWVTGPRRHAQSTVPTTQQRRPAPAEIAPRSAPFSPRAPLLSRTCPACPVPWDSVCVDYNQFTLVKVCSRGPRPARPAGLVARRAVGHTSVAVTRRLSISLAARCALTLHARSHPSVSARQRPLVGTRLLVLRPAGWGLGLVGLMVSVTWRGGALRLSSRRPLPVPSSRLLPVVEAHLQQEALPHLPRESTHHTGSGAASSGAGAAQTQSHAGAHRARA